ncbi:hypothetical protein OG301_34560 [Streptomyces platensis]|uniref:hypothetical protein n=1 Tax=Streptomyces platensis TaxID=58346 RepID=UPI002ED5474B|nr:hypothetical protein OG301_34560 [Streptomyces platensis]
MGDHFKTDVDQLARFLKNLEGCVRELKEARTALGHIRADQIGTAELDEACDNFQEKWKYGAEQTKEMIDEISEGVKENKENYEELENSLEKALKKFANENTSGGK